MPSWSDGEGNGPIHKKLREILGDGTKPGDPLFFSCAGNTAERHWSGTFNPGPGGYHVWSGKVTLNNVSPWYDDRVSLELTWADPEARYVLEVVDPTTGEPVAGCTYKQTTDRAIKHALQAPEVRESGWWGTNVVCLVTEQGYGPRGVLWIGAWLPPHDRLTTAK